MNRRNFLKATSLGAIGLTLPNLLTSCNNKVNSDAPVIVIGAGMAGLGAARALKSAGFTNITVLEARTRIGGRIWTNKTLGFPVDMGAAWIHGMRGGNPIMALAESAGASTFEANDELLAVHNTDGKVIDKGTMDTYYKDYNTMLREIENNGQAGQSLSDAVQGYNASYLNDNIMKYQLSAYAEFDAGGAIEDLDAKYWQNDKQFSGKDVLVPNGYEELALLLTDGVNVRLNAVVSQIAYDSNGVKITTTSQETYSGKYVVCTLPLGVLKGGGVTFSPALPADKQTAITRMKVGAINKVALVFPTAFWDTEQQYLGYCSNIKGQYPYFINGKKFTDRNLLITFGFGNYGLAMENQSNNQIGSDIMDVLRRMYGNTIPQYSQILVTRWAQDAFAKGSYSYMAKGLTDADFEVFSTPVQDRLFFAGEHTISKYRSTVHGAYISGLRQAEKIMDLES
ncbi:MAG: FAD-dependent oxidoreductase [Bacteroidetes bacterium]|nr:MAG: FAD-dependent oxidoreductase [Bacteroidota bacterium]